MLYVVLVSAISYFVFASFSDTLKNCLVKCNRFFLLITYLLGRTFGAILVFSLSLFEVDFLTKISVNIVLKLLGHHSPDENREEKIRMLIHSFHSPSIISLCSKAMIL